MRSSGNYYSVLGVEPQVGRAIVPADDTAASQAVAMISDEFWEREFGRSPTVLGQWIRLNDVSVMIVGVNPRTFTGAASTLPSQTPGSDGRVGEGDTRDAVCPTAATGCGSASPIGESSWVAPKRA